MDFTTTTEISKKWSKIFQIYNEAIVLNKSKSIGVILGWKLAQAVINSGILEQIREELFELQDKETLKVIKNYRSWNIVNSINLEDYKKKYGI